MNDNIRITIENIIKWKGGKKIYPSQLLIIPTNGCNLKCISCKARGKETYLPESELAEEAYLKLIDEAAELKIKSCELNGGGEPLFMYKKTTAIMRQIKKKNIEGKLFTNGVLFQKDFLKELVEIGWDTIHCSIDGPDAKTHDYLREVKGTFKRVVSNIKTIGYWKKELNKEKPKITIAALLCHQNYNKINEMIRLCKKIGVDDIYFQTLQIRNEKLGEKIMLTQKDQARFFKNLNNLKKIALEENIGTNLNQFDEFFIKKSQKLKELIKLDSKETKKRPDCVLCFKPWNNITINASGQTGVCPAMPNSRAKNSSTTSLKKFWYGKELDSLRKAFISNKIPERCSLCCGNVVLENRSIREKLKEVFDE